jgi:hypothetical protein
VCVAEGEHVGCEYGVVGFLESWSREGTRDEFAGRNVIGRQRLMRMERSTIVFWWSEIVSEQQLSC